MIIIRLSEAKLDYQRRNHTRMTYPKLSKLTGIATQTLRSIGSRKGYNTSLANVEKICRALDVPLHDMLEMIDYPPASKTKPKSKPSQKLKKITKRKKKKP